MSLPYNPYGNINPYTQAGLMQPQPQTNQNNIIWVQGEAGAKAYPVQPGGSVLLMDSEGEYFYIKTADNVGMPGPLRKFSFEEIVEGQVVTTKETPEYVTREEFEKTISELSKPRYNNYKKGDRNNE